METKATPATKAVDAAMRPVNYEIIFESEDDRQWFVAYGRWFLSD